MTKEMKVLVNDCTDYSLMNFLSYNRVPGKRKDLAESYAKLGRFLDPIKVVLTNLYSKDGSWQFYVLDGQNRLVFARDAGMPYDYLHVLTTDDEDLIKEYMKTYNTDRKNWPLEQNVNLYSNKAPYKRLLELSKKYKVSIMTAYTFLSNETRRISSYDLRYGLFKIVKGNRCVEILEEISYLRSVMPFNNRMVMAFAGFFMAEGYDRDKFAAALKKCDKQHLKLLQESKDIKDYFEKISF